MQKRYPTAVLIFAAAVAGKLAGTLGDWPAVTLILCAAVVLLGAHAFDGIQAGPIQVDTDE
jgi:hypothetical protein